MMVAFRYDNDAVGSLYYSREIPSLFGGCGCRSCSAATASSRSSRTARSCSSGARGMPRLILPGFRDIRGYQAMYRDFLASISDGRAPEMSLERALDDQRLMDAIYASLRAPRVMRTDSYDIIIIGSGAGGGTMAHALSDTSARILILERGDFVPQEEENWNPEAVWKHLRYQTKERWLDDRGVEFRPYTHYNVGGNTKFWGSVLYRLRREDFQALEHMDGVSPGLAHRLRHAGALLRACRASLPGAWPARHSIRRKPRAALSATRPSPLRRDGGDRRTTAAQGLHPSPLPLGIRDGCVLCNTCNSFACRVHAKSEADVCCVRPA